MATKYDRQAALAYARKYWNVVCSDGFIALDSVASKNNVHYQHCPGWTFQFNRATYNTGRVYLKDPPETAYGPQKQTIPWEQLNDCAHFLSCCIGSEPNEKGGGLTVKTEFPNNGPYGTLGADKLVNYLTSVVGAKIVGPSPHNDVTRISQVAAGDVVAYFKPTSAQGGGRYVHVALYLGNDKIACHTYSRSDDSNCEWDNDWNSPGARSKWQWSLLKMP